LRCLDDADKASRLVVPMFMGGLLVRRPLASRQTGASFD
jgi:hypothetical protein